MGYGNGELKPTVEVLDDLETPRPWNVTIKEECWARLAKGRGPGRPWVREPGGTLSGLTPGFSLYFVFSFSRNKKKKKPISLHPRLNNLAIV